MDLHYNISSSSQILLEGCYRSNNKLHTHNSEDVPRTVLVIFEIPITHLELAPKL